LTSPNVFIHQDELDSIITRLECVHCNASIFAVLLIISLVLSYQLNEKFVHVEDFIM